MNSFGESYIIQFQEGPEVLVKHFDRSNVPRVFNLYIHAQCELHKQIHRYKCGGVDCKIDERFESFAKTYAHEHSISLAKAYIKLYEASAVTAREAALATVKELMNEYNIKTPYLKRSSVLIKAIYRNT